MIRSTLRFEKGATASHASHSRVPFFQSVNWLARELPDPKHQMEYAQERAIVAVTEAVQRAMDDLGISQRDLARQLDVTEGHISRILDGERNMTLRTLGNLLFACGLELKTIETEALGVCLMPPAEAEAWRSLGEQSGVSAVPETRVAAPAVAA